MDKAHKIVLAEKITVRICNYLGDLGEYLPIHKIVMDSLSHEGMNFGDHKFHGENYECLHCGKTWIECVEVDNDEQYQVKEGVKDNE